MLYVLSTPGLFWGPVGGSWLSAVEIVETLLIRITSVGHRVVLVFFDTSRMFWVTDASKLLLREIIFLHLQQCYTETSIPVSCKHFSCPDASFFNYFNKINPSLCFYETQGVLAYPLYGNPKAYTIPVYATSSITFYCMLYVI